MFNCGLLFNLNFLLINFICLCMLCKLILCFCSVFLLENFILLLCIISCNILFICCSNIVIFLVLVCFLILLSDFCIIWYNVVVIFDFSLLGWVLNNILIFICECSLKFLSSVVSVVCKLRLFSVLGCKWCEICWILLIVVINECWDFFRCMICLGLFSWLVSNLRWYLLDINNWLILLCSLWVRCFFLFFWNNMVLCIKFLRFLFVKWCLCRLMVKVNIMIIVIVIIKIIIIEKKVVLIFVFIVVCIFLILWLRFLMYKLVLIIYF